VVVLVVTWVVAFFDGLGNRTAFTRVFMPDLFLRKFLRRIFFLFGVLKSTGITAKRGKISGVFFCDYSTTPMGTHEFLN
jgi:hypothetical protein